MSTSAQPTPANPPDAVPAPADGRRLAVREAWKNAAGYLAAAAAVLAVVTVTLQLWHARLKVPLYGGGDNLMAQMFVQNILESGWVLDNARLGAPGALDMRDYPIPDVLHVALIRLLGLASHDSAVVLNLYYLMAFPLTAVSAYFVAAAGCGWAASPPSPPRSFTPACRFTSSGSPATFSSRPTTSYR